MKKILMILLAIAICPVANAWGHCGPCRPIHRWNGAWGGYHHHGYYHHGGYWGRGGCNFWPGFVGGVVGGVIGGAIARPYYADTTVMVQQPTTVVTTPTVVQQQPVVVQQPTVVTAPVVQPVVQYPRQTWIQGHYEYQIVNGIQTRIWIPGHYE